MRTQTENVYYQPGQSCVIDFICTDGLTQWGKQTAAEVQARYPGAIVMNWKEASDAIDANSRSEVSEIDEETYTYFLEVLPPVGWTGKDGVSSFKMSERLCGNITGIYAQMQGRFFTFNDSIFTTHDEIVARITAYINA